MFDKLIRLLALYAALRRADVQYIRLYESERQYFVMLSSTAVQGIIHLFAAAIIAYLSGLFPGV
jgi:hypothetical protein